MKRRIGCSDRLRAVPWRRGWRLCGPLPSHALELRFGAIFAGAGGQALPNSRPGLGAVAGCRGAAVDGVRKLPHRTVAEQDPQAVGVAGSGNLLQVQPAIDRFIGIVEMERRRWPRRFPRGDQRRSPAGDPKQAVERSRRRCAGFLDLDLRGEGMLGGEHRDRQALDGVLAARNHAPCQRQALLPSARREVPLRARPSAIQIGLRGAPGPMEARKAVPRSMPRQKRCQTPWLPRRRAWSKRVAPTWRQAPTRIVRIRNPFAPSNAKSYRWSILAGYVPRRPQCHPILPAARLQGLQWCRQHRRKPWLCRRPNRAAAASGKKAAENQEAEHEGSPGSCPRTSRAPRRLLRPRRRSRTPGRRTPIPLPSNLRPTRRIAAWPIVSQDRMAVPNSMPRQPLSSSRNLRCCRQSSAGKDRPPPRAPVRRPIGQLGGFFLGDRIGGRHDFASAPLERQAALGEVSDRRSFGQRRGESKVQFRCRGFDFLHLDFRFNAGHFASDIRRGIPPAQGGREPMPAELPAREG